MAKTLYATVKVMGGGRVTIPSEIREVENIKEGSYLKISIEKIEGIDTDKNLKLKNGKTSNRGKKFVYRVGK
jgi:AbrB family looped-hinge helix DNA binding protein